MTTILYGTYGYNFAGFKKYALNRFLRLYPVYWTLVVISALFVGFVGDEFSTAFHPKMQIPTAPIDIVENLTLAYPSFTPVDYPVRLSPATWALTLEMIFYFLIGLGLSRSLMVTSIWFAASLGYLFYNIISVGNMTIGYGNVLSASLHFSMGGMIYWYKEEIKRVMVGLTSNYSYVFLVLFVLNLVVVAGGGSFHLTMVGNPILSGVT